MEHAPTPRRSPPFRPLTLLERLLFTRAPHTHLLRAASTTLHSLHHQSEDVLFHVWRRVVIVVNIVERRAAREQRSDQMHELAIVLEQIIRRLVKLADELQIAESDKCTERMLMYISNVLLKRLHTITEASKNKTEQNQGSKSTDDDIAIEDMSDELANLIERCQTSFKTDCGRRSLLHIVQEIAGTVMNQKYSVAIGGSCISMLENDSSDIDMILIGSDKIQTSPSKSRSARVLQRFSRELRKHRNVKIVPIYRARVPVVKLQLGDGVAEGDIAIPHPRTLLVHQMLLQFFLYDDRYRTLIMILKEWRKMRNLGDATTGQLNSLCYSLMLAQFLQNINPPVLPHVSLPEDMELNKSEIVEFVSRNTNSVETLLFLFFQDTLKKFQNNHIFSFNQDVSNIENWENYVTIVNPLDETHNIAQSCSTSRNFSRLCKEMHRAVEIFTDYSKSFFKCLLERTDQVSQQQRRRQRKRKRTLDVGPPGKRQKFRKRSRTL